MIMVNYFFGETENIKMLRKYKEILKLYDNRL